MPDMFSGSITDVRGSRFSTCETVVELTGISAGVFRFATDVLTSTSAKYTCRADCGSTARVARIGAGLIGEMVGRVSLDVVVVFLVCRGDFVSRFAPATSDGRGAPKADLGRSHVSQTANKLCNMLDIF